VRARPIGGGRGPGQGCLREREAATTQWLLLVALLILISGCTVGRKETGILEGHVTIGPLVPVVREGEPEPTPAPEVYASRQIVIYTKDGRSEITRVQIDAKGNYWVELPAGTYVVDINRMGIDRGIDLPTKVEILGGATTRLDIEIDTGIR
jgi:hypothetical protein